ncbi:DUF6869 domain-containing protein [Palleronia sp.]|uniref:DUF6869 domain-containing protein n=1 Tax=Palleronia sp. TaxID=1940284 RepID=UPI0035C7C7D7
MIPRARVAAALDLPPDTDALPPGDLPLDRFAERFLSALERPEGDETDIWTVDLFDHLVMADPKLACASLLACFDRAPERAEELGAGPLDDLVRRAGTDAVGPLEAAAPDRPALRRAMRQVSAEEIEHPFLKARIEAIRD